VFGEWRNGETWPVGLIEVAANTFAYVQAPGSAGISNAGVVLGPDRAVVVDALTTNPMALAFLGKLRSVTALPISHLLLTHHHVDHFLGIQNFLPTQVVSHEQCRDKIARRGEATLANYRQARPHFVEGLRDTRICVPDQTFDQRLTLYLGDREVQFFHWGYAHTRGDAMIYLPREKVLYAGDIAFHRVTPLAHEGHIGNWLQVVDRVLALDVETIVPGHGPVGGKSELELMRGYLQRVYTATRECFDAGLPEEEAAASIDVGPYRDWVDAERLGPNVKRAYGEFRGDLAAPSAAADC